MKKISFLIIAICVTTFIFAQCDITEKLMADGTMNYYAATVPFYKTNTFQLAGNVVTDKENYFLRLKPFPFDAKLKKIKNDLLVKLLNDTTYTLKAYDSWFNDKDSSYTLLYLFKEDDIPAFLNNKVAEITINTDNTTDKIYRLKLHPDAIQVQLACFVQKKYAF